MLIADRRWRTLIIAAIVAVALAGLSWLAFGTATWEAFAHATPLTSRIVLGEGGADFARLQSLFGLVRAHGGGEALGLDGAGESARSRWPRVSSCCGEAARLTS